MLTQKKVTSFHIGIRWMLKRDIPAVLDIGQESFEFPWSKEDFIRCLRQRNCISMIAEHLQTKLVVSYMIYELHRSRLHLLSLAVAKKFRRQNIGRQMITKLIGRLSPQRRNRLLLEVRETNLDAQLFFQATGFRAIAILKNFYEDTAEDAYLMQYCCQHPHDDPYRNRISHIVE